MKTTEFKDSFFVELLAYVNAYGTLYVTSDGNMFRSKVDATDRCKDTFERSKGKKTMQWAKITPANCPADNEAFTSIMEKYVDEDENAVKEPSPVIDIEKAKTEIEKKRKSKSKVNNL